MKSYILRHDFNGDSKQTGPALIIEVVMSRPKKKGQLNAYIAHRWKGDGRATIKEMNRLIRHLRNGELFVVADYIELVVS